MPDQVFDDDKNAHNIRQLGNVRNNYQGEGEGEHQTCYSLRNMSILILNCLDKTCERPLKLKLVEGGYRDWQYIGNCIDIILVRIRFDYGYQ